MIELSGFHLQVAGILVLLAMGAGFLWWTVAAVLGLHRGDPVYMLPEPQDEEPDDDGDPTGT